MDATRPITHEGYKIFTETSYTDINAKNPLDQPISDQISNIESLVKKHNESASNLKIAMIFTPIPLLFAISNILRLLYPIATIAAPSKVFLTAQIGIGLLGSGISYRYALVRSLLLKKFAKSQTRLSSTSDRLLS